MENILLGSGILIAAFTALPFIGVVLFLVALVLKGKKQSRDTNNWSMTTGKVIDAKVVTTRSSGNNDGFHDTSYSPSITYAYTVGGKKYSSDQYQPGFVVSWRSAASAEQKVRDYPAGKTVQVYYNPVDPSQAVLEKKASAGSKIFTWVAILIVVVLLIVVASIAGVLYFINQIAF